AQASGLTEIQNEITTLKASQGNLVQEAQSLRGMYQELQSAAESNVDISDALKSSGIGTATRSLESRLVETGKGVSAVEAKLNNVGQQVDQQKEQRAPQTVTKQETHPPGASAICRDGTFSFSQNRRGTCSHHGGVARWL